MLISTKGRYALRVMLELASRRNGEFVPLNLIAKEQEISEKYLESIVAVLIKGGMLEGVRGKGGGYRLNRDPSEYSVGEILSLTEGSLAPVSCLGTKTCTRSSSCKTLPLWKNRDTLISDYLNGVKLSDLI